jgi:hypothetical protein
MYDDQAGVTTPNVKNRTFRFVAKTYRLQEANRNTFMQRRFSGFWPDERVVCSG